MALFSPFPFFPLSYSHFRLSAIVPPSSFVSLVVRHNAAVYCRIGAAAEEVAQAEAATPCLVLFCLCYVTTAILMTSVTRRRLSL